MRSVHSAIFLSAWLLTACSRPEKDVPCTADTDCNLSSGGICTQAATGNQWCAYPDPECSGGLRYSNQSVGDDLAGACVDAFTKSITIKVGGNGAGQVVSDPAGIVCSSGTCTGKFPVGTFVKLFATATTGAFLGWTGGCRGQGECNVSMDRDQSVGAWFGAPGDVLWAQQIGSGGREIGHGIAIDSQDNLVAVGEFSQTIQLAGTSLQSAGGTDIYVVKLESASGKLLWAKRFGGTGNDIGLSVAVAADNSIYVAGSFEGTVDFGGGPYQAGLSDGFALKLNEQGDFFWSRQIGGPNIDTANTVAVNDNGVVVAGSYTSSLTIDAVTFHSSYNTTDIFVLKLTSMNGATNWVKSYGDGFFDEARGATIDSSGNVVVTGQFAGAVSFGGSILYTQSNSTAVFLLKLDGNGGHLFSKQFGAASGARGVAVAVDTFNNIVITGDFAGSVDFGCVDRLTAPSLADIFLAKYSQAGNCLWARSFTGTGSGAYRKGNAVAINEDDDVAFTGWFSGTISLGGPIFTSASAATDMYVARYNRDGGYLTSVRAGGTGFESAWGIAENADGRSFVTGAFQGFAEFGSGALTSAGGDDAFITALAPL